MKWKNEQGRTGELHEREEVKRKHLDKLYLESIQKRKKQK